MPTVFRVLTRNDHLVSLSDADLVIATRAAVRLFRLIRLDVTDVDAVVGFGPAMRIHNASHGTAASFRIDARCSSRAPRVTDSGCGLGST
jgi:hypothetical protein